MRYNIRFATIQDVPSVSRLMFDYFEGKMPLDTIIDFLLTDKLQIVVAELIKRKSKIIGAGIFNYKYELGNKETPAILGNYVYVEPEHRGKGVFIKLLDFLESFAKEKGIQKIYLGTNMSKLLEKRGYNKVHEVHVKILGGGTDECHR